MFPQKDSLHWAHPLVGEWFNNKFGSPTQSQIEGWAHILQNKSTLISAPTGSGKTFAAFLICVDKLVRQALSGEIQNRTEVVYVSPLKALSNDIQKNLKQPLEEIFELAKQKGMQPNEIRVAVRTGDTPTKERQAMLRNVPHILVTTPESLYILLTAEKSRLMLASTKTVIVDEIHAIANTKRGSHLSLSLERLEALTGPLLRIGLSATQKPIKLVADFLAGNDRPPIAIVDMGHARKIDVAIEVPSSELGPIASNEMWDEIYDRIIELAEQNRSTLVFVNTRRLAERVAHRLGERLGVDQVATHHGSLSRKIRLDAETKLKNGELKILVATASLELGIDIGAIDLVCQMGSPRAIAVALQRIGRAGHWHGAISKGRIFVTTRDELIECAALIDAMLNNELDQLIIPAQPLDILAQQIVATCATSEWQEAKLFQLIKQSFSYKNLSQETFNSVIQILADGITGSRGRYGAYLFRDQVNGTVKARRGSRLIAITSGGAIPENGLYTVIAEPTGTIVGTLDEDFAIESNRGDIILLGTTSWRIKRVESKMGQVLVEDAYGAPPSVPFWRGEAPARTNELSFSVSRLREKIANMLLVKQSEHEIIDWLKENCHVDQSGADQIVKYISEGQAILGAVPTQKTIIAERFFDESGGMQLIIHAPFGARINKAWGLALRKRFCRSFNFELQASATDDGINIALAEQHSFPLADVFNFLHPNSVHDVLIQAILQAPIFNTRWRWNATRSLALLRFRNGKKVPPNILRMRADDLLAAVFPDAAACQDNLAGHEIEIPDHPLINETIKDALTEAMDLEGIINILNDIYNGNIKCLAVDTPTASAFSHEILNANPYAFLDDAPLEERRARAVELRRVLPEKVLQEVGKLDPDVIKEVQQQAWPDVRNADELQDVLQTLIAFPSDYVRQEFSAVEWEKFFNELLEKKRAIIAKVNNRNFWLVPEKVQLFKQIFSDAVFLTPVVPIEQSQLEKEEAMVMMLRGWLQHLGPTTCLELSHFLELEEKVIEQGILKLETTGLILRGKFCEVDWVESSKPNTIAPSETPQQVRGDRVEQWCERRLLARIHRATLGKLRKQIAPVTAAQFMQWLLKWQHLAPKTQLKTKQGLLEIIKQLQGFEAASNAWESQIFSKRVSDYKRDMLDQLCLSGVIGWGRFSPHSGTSKRINPTSVAPITFFVREESQWLLQPNDKQSEFERLSFTAQNVYTFLQEKGASFIFDIVKNVKGVHAEVETALWELVAAGMITADSFDNLRGLIDPKRRLRKKYIPSGGRWSILNAGESETSEKQIESLCWLLLKRYGVVFRDLLLREKNLPKWRELLLMFRKLEDRGEIRGGRFVSGFLGEQFALPYAVESLRAMKNEVSSENKISLSAADPLNLVGIILPGNRIAASSKGKVQV